MKLVFPRLYIILDRGQIAGDVVEFASQLADAGVELFQLRDKAGSGDTVLASARALVEHLRPRGACLVVNDRPDIAAMAGATGTHVGQDDLRPDEARSIVGSGRWLGVSTHNLEQVRNAAGSPADYIAVGPVFSTTTKANPEPIVGLELIRKARAITDKPLVGIGGITLERAAEVLASGADSVAVAGDILSHADPAGRARAYLETLGRSAFLLMFLLPS